MNFDLGKFSADFVRKQMDHSTFESVMLFANGLLTFLFGYTYGGNLIPGLDGLTSNITSGLMCTLFFDYAANRWDAKTSAEGSSQEQLITAARLRWLGLISSTGVSLLYLALSMSLVDLSDSKETIGKISAILVGLVAGVNFLGVYLYRSQSPEILEAKRASETKAAALAVEHHNREQVAKVRLQGKILATQSISKGVFKRILEETPALAEKEADQVLGDWKREWDSYENELESMTNEVAEKDPLGSQAEEAYSQMLETEAIEIDLTNPSPTYDDPRFKDGGKHDAEERAKRDDYRQRPPVPGK